MNRFSADFSSSPPSTPNTQGKQQLRNPLFAGFSNHPSTTPAGPPPSSAASFTPAGPPPSTTFGSSRIGSNVSKLQFSKDSLSSSRPLHSPAPPIFSQLHPRVKNGTPTQPEADTSRLQSRGFASTSGPLRYGTAVNEDEEEEYDESMEQDEEDDESEIDEAPQGGFFGKSSIHERDAVPQFATHPNRRSQLRSSRNDKRKPARVTQLPRKGKADLIPRIARDMVSRSAKASLNDPDEVVISTEAVMKELHEELLESNGDDNTQAMISSYAHELIRIWRDHAKTEAVGGEGVIGPSASASPFEQANYIASLLLALYHPPLSDKISPNHSISASKSVSLVPISAQETMPLPQIILDWLDNYHVSYDALFGAVRSATPNCTSHALFWDAVQSLTLRGETRKVSDLFAQADFKYAVSALDDGLDTPGYHGTQLQIVQSLVYRAHQVLEGCPGTKNADWQTDNADWDLYRKRVMTEVEHLLTLADENDEDDDDDEDSFEARNFGILPTKTQRRGRSTRAMEGNIPPTIFQNLKIMYRILLGNSEEILAQSQDWLEATTSLTIWWDGIEDDDIEAWSLSVTQSQTPNTSSAASNPYLARLRAAFLCSIDPEGESHFQMNTMSPTELGIGLVLQGEVEAAVLLLQTFSLCVSSAIAEVGSSAGWMTGSVAPGASGLDQEDLMVLSYGASESVAVKDELLLAYAEALFGRQEIIAENGLPIEGWEIGLSVASRFDDQELIQTTISSFLDQLQLQEQDHVDKLVSLCYDLGLEEDARKVSEKFADHLVNNTSRYGTALLCYARGHASNKIRQVIDLLISYCLVQSRIYPLDEEMDEDLRHLVESPKAALSGLADVDPEAAQILQFYLVGYACLRKFYGLRDDEILAAKTGSKPTFRPIARKRLAAKALVAAINSAADSIYGGLYDAERQSAIQVDGLLTLLGEATAFLAQGSDHRTFTSEQMYGLLAAIEDLQMVNSRVYDATEECLQAALRNFHGSQPPSPHAMLQKSVSSGTNSNFSFSMMGSEMLAKSGESGGQSVGSMVVVGGTGDGQRGWDWRAQFKEKGATGADVLKCLRFGIARELSLAEFEL